MDKALFRQIKQSDFVVPAGHTVQALTPSLFEALGSTDPELRDQLAYEILATWMERRYFAPDHLRSLAVQAAASLRHAVGAPSGDGVFLRAFAVLILTEIVAQDAGDRFLSESDLAQLKASVLAYFADEQDLRGWVEGKGWAHAVAHTADFLRALSGHPAVGAAELLEVLHAVAAKVTASTGYPYLANEEDRLALAVAQVYKRSLLSEADWQAWLDSIALLRPWRDQFVAGQEIVAYHNAKAFLCSLLLLLPDGAPDLSGPVRAALRAFAPRWF